MSKLATSGVACVLTLIGIAGCGGAQSEGVTESGTSSVKFSGPANSTCSFKLMPTPGHGQERQTKPITALDFCRSAKTASRYELDVAPDGQSGRLRLYKDVPDPPQPVEHQVDFE